MNNRDHPELLHLISRTSQKNKGGKGEGKRLVGGKKQSRKQSHDLSLLEGGNVQRMTNQQQPSSQSSDMSRFLYPSNIVKTTNPSSLIGIDVSTLPPSFDEIVLQMANPKNNTMLRDQQIEEDEDENGRSQLVELQSPSSFLSTNKNRPSNQPSNRKQQQQPSTTTSNNNSNFNLFSSLDWIITPNMVLEGDSDQELEGENEIFNQTSQDEQDEDNGFYYQLDKQSTNNNNLVKNKNFIGQTNSIDELDGNGGNAGGFIRCVVFIVFFLHFPYFCFIFC